MKDLKIYRGTTHDGDLQGRLCTLFVQRYNEFSHKFLQIDDKSVNCKCKFMISKESQ